MGFKTITLRIVPALKSNSFKNVCSICTEQLGINDSILIIHHQGYQSIAHSQCYTDNLDI